MTRVRWMAWAAALAVPLAVAPAGGSEPLGDIAWEPDLESALQGSRADRKPVMLYFTFET